jgi:sec-independent protein translocase protein TatC
MPISPDDHLSLLEHLDELRKRLTFCLIAGTVGVLVAAIFNSFVFEALLWPLRQVKGLEPAAYQITTFSPAEPFMVSLKVWVAGGLIMASPIIIWQLWAYLAPAFTPTEKKYFYPVVIASTSLFLGGVALAYFLVLPRGLGFLLNFSSGYFNVQNRASDYFTFIALFILAFGVVFELPVVLVLLAKVGVIDDRFLRKNRRYAILVLAVASAIITPSQDAFSMLAMFVPLYLLFEISIVLARIVQPKEPKHSEREARAAAEDPPGGDDTASRAPA